MGLRINGSDVSGMRRNSADASEARFNGAVVWPAGVPGCLQFTPATSGGCTIGLSDINKQWSDGEDSTPYSDLSLYFEVSYDGVNWTNYRCDQFPTVQLAEGESLYVRGSNDHLNNAKYIFHWDGYPLHSYGETVINSGVSFTGRGAFNVFGDISSLVADGAELTDGCFAYLFAGSPIRKSPSFLKYDVLGDFACMSTFYDCANLLTAPELPATDIGRGAYMNMFSQCTYMRTGPSILPARVQHIVGGGEYSHMFSGCSRMTTGPSNILLRSGPGGAQSATFYGVFTQCSALSSPVRIQYDAVGTQVEPPPNSLGSPCNVFTRAFSGCRSLTDIELHIPSWGPLLKGPVLSGDGSYVTEWYMVDCNTFDAFAETPESGVLRVPSGVAAEWYSTRAPFVLSDCPGLVDVYMEPNYVTLRPNDGWRYVRI